MYALVEYGIMWSSETERGSVTPMVSKELAERYLWLATSLPGTLAGRVVQRLVTHSEWTPIS